MIFSKRSPFYVLRHRDFKLLWIGLFISRIGSEMQVVGMNWHVYLMTGSAFSLGLVGLSRFLPVALIALPGGVAADIFDRRKLMLISQTIQTAAALFLTVATFANYVSPELIYLTILIASAAAAIDTPARQAVLPHLVPKVDFAKATSINSTMWQTAVVLGPSLAGFTIAYAGIGAVYLINTLSFIAVIASLILMSPIPKIVEKRVEFNLTSVKVGLHFVFKTPIIASSMLLDFFATFFASATVLMPIFAKDILNVGAEGLGFLYAAPATGAVIAGLILASKKEIRHQGKLLLSAVVIFGMATILFGISRNFYLSLFFIFIAGAADMISSVIRSTLRQLLTPDRLRGRMVSINQIFFYGGPQLGEVEAGLVAGLISAPFAVVTGGIGAILVTITVGFLVPALRRYKGHEEVKLI